MTRLSSSSRTGLFAATAMAGALALGAGAARAQAAQETVSTGAPEAPADPRDAEIRALHDEVAALAAQVADLKTAMSSGLKDLRDTAAAEDKVVIAAGKPSIQSADGRFTANLHGIVHLDTAAYFQHDVPAAQSDPHAQDLNDGTNFRRARLAVDGKMFGDFNYNLTAEFGGSGAEDAGRLYEAWIEYVGFKPLRLRAGAFAPSLGLEDANSTNGMPFMERPTPSEVARALAGGDSRVAGQIAASGDHWLAAAAVTGNLVSSLNTAASGFTAQSFDEQLGYTARLAASPFHGADWLIHLGANGSIVAQPADAGPAAAVRYGVQLRERPELRVDGSRLIDTGAIDADGARQWGLELAAQKKNFYVQGEYFDISVQRRNPALSDPSFHGWYVEGSWLLTGEQRRYNTLTAAFDAPPVAHPLTRDGGYGAFEIAARYSDMDLNYREGAAGSAAAADAIRGGEQKIFSLGLNWYVNSAIRFMLDYQHVDIDRLNGSGAEIGQNYNALAVRSQLAF